MIPLRDANPSEGKPIVTITLIVLNVLVYLYQWTLAGAEQLIPFFDTWAIVPIQLTTSFASESFTLITAMFLHGSWMHLIGNMLYLWIFGDNIEDKLGHLRFLSFYIMCGIVASLSLIFTNLNSQIPSVGASGAIAGVMGAYMFLFPKARIRTLMIWLIFIQVIRIPAVIILGYWILIQVLSGFVEYGAQSRSSIAWFAHIGGFVTGLLLIIMMKIRGKKT